MNSKPATRRQFLKKSARTITTALAFPYIIPASALGKSGVIAPSNRITMGCIGVGSQGTRNMLGFAQNPDVQIVALCDVYEMSPNKTGLKMAREALLESPDYNNKTHDIGMYRDFRELLSRDDIDAVSIATPDHWHGLISIAAAKAGKDIFCEKPLANTITEGRAVCSAVKHYNRVFQTGSHERSNDSVRYACELVRNGRIGKLHTIKVNLPHNDKHHLRMFSESIPQPVIPIPETLDYDFWLGPAPYRPHIRYQLPLWRFVFDFGGGEITDRGAHILDLAQFGNDTDNTGPLEISAQGEIAPDGLFDTFFNYSFQCNYANGVRIIGTNKEPRGLKFQGNNGWLFIHIHGGQLEASTESLLRERIGPNEINLGRTSDHKRDFLDAVITRRFETIASAEIGHRSATICHLINIAMSTTGKIKWDPLKEQITNNPAASRMLSRPMRKPWHI